MTRWLFVVCLLQLVGPAWANVYESPIDIQSEEDLFDLCDQGEISEETRDALLRLLEQGVDLNRADRATLYRLPNLTYADVDAILSYRETIGWISDLEVLVISGVLEPDKLSAITPFLVLGPSPSPGLPVAGWLRSQSRYAQSDRAIPPVALQGQVAAWNSVRAGFASTVTRNRLGTVVYDPGRDALTARPEATRVELPRLYVEWQTSGFRAIAGTYRAGFGQGLTFDNDFQVNPSGIVVDDDYRYRPGLQGFAAHLALARAQMTVFTSLQARSIYQYEIYDRNRCADPRDNDDDMCEAPDVFRTADDPLAPTTEFSYQTLPAMYREMIVGGNVSYRPVRRAQVGVTGYGATTSFLTRGIDLDFQEWSPMPFGGPFGAIGIDGTYRFGATSLFAEATRSFDSEPGAGGLGALVRALGHWQRSELELAARYYDRDFANPYAHPFAEPDEYQGNRARDESGLATRYSARVTDAMNVRTMLDLWRSPSTGKNHLASSARTDYKLSSSLSTALSAAYLASRKLALAWRLRIDKRRWYASVMYQHSVIDEPGTMSRPRFENDYRQDISAVIALSVRPTKDLLLRARSRYLSEDIDSNTFLEQSVHSYLDLVWQVRSRDRLRLRYDLGLVFDHRKRTTERPRIREHGLWFEYESRF